MKYVRGLYRSIIILRAMQMYLTFLFLKCAPGTVDVVYTAISYWQPSRLLFIRVKLSLLVG